jgi:hypothetical protein
MAGILSVVGDTEFDAAKRHLENIKTMWANNPHLSQKEKQELANRYVELAIGDLERAYDKFVRTAPKGLPRFLKESRLGGSGYAERAKAYGKACEAALLESVCYKYIRDSGTAAKYLSKAETFYDEYSKAAMDDFLQSKTYWAPGVAGMSYGRWIEPSKSEVKAMEDQLKKEKDRLNKLTLWTTTGRRP